MSSNAGQVIEHILEVCLEQMEAGATLVDCLKQYPEQAAELRPMLEITQSLHNLPAIAATPEQVAGMQSRMLEKLHTAPSSSPLSGQGLWIVAGITLVILLIVGIALENRQHSDNAVTQVPENAPLSVTEESPELSETPLSDLTDSPDVMQPDIFDEALETPPEMSETAGFENSEDSSLSVSDEAMLPVTVVLSGSVENIDEEAGAIILDGVTVQVNFAHLPDNVAINESVSLAIEGELLNDGTVVASEVLPADDLEAVNSENGLSDESAEGTVAGAVSDCETARCHPVLTILAETYGVAYADLENLHQQGTGVGEIARLLILSEASGVEMDILQAQRESGMTWGEIIRTYPDITPGNLAPGQIIRQNPPGHSGNGNSGQGNGNQGQGNNGNGNRPDNPGGGPPDSPGDKADKKP